VCHGMASVFLQAESLTLRVEPGWSQNGQPPRGFWATGGLTAEQPDGNPNKLSDATVVVLAACLVTAVVASVLACLAFVFWRKRAAENRQQRAQRAAATDGELGSVKAGSEPGSRASDQHGRTGHGSSGEPDVSGSGSGMGVLAGGRRFRGSGILPGLLRDSMPVHDSSDSYNIPEAVDRAALTAELARSKFGPRNLSAQDDGRSTSSSGGSSGGGRGGRGRDRDRPPAAAGGGASTTSMASDACLQRLQSAITTMSQDVLSRRLQYAMGADGSPVVMGMAAAGTAVGLGRPSPLSLAQGGQQQERQGLTPPLEGSDADGNAFQQQHSGSLLGRRSSSPLGRASTHHGSPNAAAVAAATALAEQQQREGSGGLEAADAQPFGPRVPGVVPTKALSQGGGPAALADAAACGGGAGGLAKSSVGSAASRMGSLGGIEQLKLLQLVGQGTFGQVYKALWRRRCVAVKVLQLPATAGSSDVPWRGMGRATSHREKMAVMETVVSTTMRYALVL